VLRLCHLCCFLPPLISTSGGRFPRAWPQLLLFHYRVTIRIFGLMLFPLESPPYVPINSTASSHLVLFRLLRYSCSIFYFNALFVFAIFHFIFPETEHIVLFHLFRNVFNVTHEKYTPPCLKKLYYYLVVKER